MRCECARDALLEADAHVLRGRGEHPLVEHVRGCPRCGRLAEALLAAESALAQAMEVEGALSADRLEALLRARSDPAGAPTKVRRLQESIRLGRRRWGVPALVAAALVLALWPGEPSPPGLPPQAAPSLEGQEPLIDLQSGRDIAVLGTADPAITIVWFF